MAFADGMGEPARSVIVPLTWLGICGFATAVFAEAGAAESVGPDGLGALLQPAKANAATDISDKTVLRMGKPH
ncbi:MAG: hypothetical protein WBG81_06195 [Rhodanobacter sp.]|uniref:hypothetical protein n=1 Tax=Rhodanobacter sp. KK11 TaxID=3083255 RepID=UPI002966C61E|nr:hypothetical protein [Rhodanobacter sp. KK11]MDW2979976.1 hypothetical protein [Rhodanobacter sp. KK11]